MIKKTTLKCDCGCTAFRVSVIGDNKLVLYCTKEGCENFFEISHDPSLKDITHAVATNLGDYAVNKIGEFIIGGVDNGKRRK
jgi:hypothetical protein